MLLCANSCVKIRHYQITLSDTCIADKTAEFKRTDLKSADIAGNRKALDNMITKAKDKAEQQLLEDIKSAQEVKVMANKYFEIECFSSPYVPIYAQYQDFEVTIPMSDPLFLSAVGYKMAEKQTTTSF